MMGLWLQSLVKDRDNLRDTLLRQYRRIGGGSGASAPLRAAALSRLLSVLQRDETGGRWTLDDEDVANLSEKPAGRFLSDLLEEKRSR